ncbi:MAG: cache domain-containing protein, partial [Treponema sp.]|nr:cache domain-containing protein [Treponema sp.]
MAQKRSRLVTKLLVVVLAIIMLMTVIQSFVIISSVKKTTGTSYEEECKALTNVYVDLLSSKIQEYKNLLQVYTNADIVKTGDPKAIVDWLQSHAEIRSPEFDYVAFVDLEGNFDSDIMTHTTVPDRSYYIDIIKNGLDETMDNPVASKVSGKYVVHICKAARANGRVIGFFTGIVTLEKLQNIIKNIKIGESGYATLMSGEHSVIATSNEITVEDTSDAVNDTIAKGTMVDAVMKAISTNSLQDTWDYTTEGKRCYLTFKPVEGTPSWLFMFSIEEDQVYEAANSVIRLMIGVASVYIIIMLVVIGILVSTS